MTIYRIELSETYSGTVFDFTDYGEAMGFVGIALENGRKDGKDLTAKISIIRSEVGLNE